MNQSDVDNLRDTNESLNEASEQIAERVELARHINMSQWRRDIQTFVDETTNSLDEIAGRIQGKAQSTNNSRNSVGKPAIKKPSLEVETSTGAKETESRIASLKKQLAKQILANDLQNPKKDPPTIGLENEPDEMSSANPFE